MNEENDTELGGKFWLVIIGGTIAFVTAGIVLFLVITSAWYRWGFLGMFLFFSAILLGVGWISDRRAKRKWDSLGPM